MKGPHFILLLLLLFFSDDFELLFHVELKWTPCLGFFCHDISMDKVFVMPSVELLLLMLVQGDLAAAIRCGDTERPEFGDEGVRLFFTF